LLTDLLSFSPVGRYVLLADFSIFIEFVDLRTLSHVGIFNAAL
jgi:hypothetical protein